MTDTTEAAAEAAPAFARVVTPFDGCRDGEYQPVTFAAGEVLSGEIAAAALKLGFGKPATAEDFAEAEAARLAPPPASPPGEPNIGDALAKVAELRNALDLQHQANADLEKALLAARDEIAKLKAEAAAGADARAGKAKG